MPESVWAHMGVNS